MIELIFVSILQAVAGDPLATAAAPEPAAATEQVATAGPADEAAPLPGERVRVFRCRTEPVTASRVRTQRVCSTEQQDAATQERSRRAVEDGFNRGGPGLRDPGGG